MSSRGRQRDAPTRLGSLDALRGVAALVVVLHHCLLSVPGWAENRGTLLRDGLASPRAWVYLTPLRLLVDGPAAVLIFFVLSGLVLAMTFVERDADHYAPFLVKRMTRIWPAFAAAILASAVLQAVLGGRVPPGVSGWFAYTWSLPLTAGLIANHLAMFTTTPDLDSPMWSLVHEMRISLVFPLLVLLTARDWRTALGGSVVLAVIAVKAAGQHGAHPMTRSLAMTLAFAFLFVAGIAMATRLRELRGFLARLPPQISAAIWLAALAGLSVPPESTADMGRWRDAFLLLTSGFSAAAIVLLCTVEGRASRILTGPLPAYLGRISYSLYLIHVVVIVAVVHALSGAAPIPVLVALGAALSIPLADLSERCIERPAMARGRRWARFVAEQQATAFSDR